MTAARLTAAQARRLGITTRPTSGRTTRRSAPIRGTYHTRCTTCDDEFRTVAAEDRHLDEQRHHRYELVLT